MYIGLHEVREIPKGWRHPIDENGVPVPLFAAGTWRDQSDPEAAVAPDKCIPEAHAEAELVVYETCTEGTPVTRAFPNTPEGKRDLLAYCAEHVTTLGDHRTGIAGWVAIVFGDAGVTLDGTVHG